jgi:plastocyanin
MKKYIILSFAILLFAGCAQQPAQQQAAPAVTPVTETATQQQAAQQQKTSLTVTAGEQTINISNYAFNPATITISAGTTVTWTNSDSATHKVVSDSNPAAFSSGDITQGGTYLFTFSTPGTYDYHCQIHPSMKGTITVTQ